MTTRRDALVAAGALVLAGLRPVAAEAAGKNVALLGVLVGYNDAVLAAYERTLRAAQMPQRERTRLETLRGQAEQDDRELRRTLAGAGAGPVPARRPATGTGDLRAVVDAEQATVGAYYVSLQSVAERPLIAEITGLMAQAGRRLVQLRELAGDAPLQAAFETGGR